MGREKKAEGSKVFSIVGYKKIKTIRYFGMRQFSFHNTFFKRG